MASADPTRRLAWIGALIFGILAVASAIWLHLKVKPELLTTENAKEVPQELIPGDPSQPGGAPSA